MYVCMYASAHSSQVSSNAALSDRSLVCLFGCPNPCLSYPGLFLNLMYFCMYLSNTSLFRAFDSSQSTRLLASSGSGGGAVAGQSEFRVDGLKHR